MEKIQWVIALAGLLAGSGIFLVLKNVIKEFKDVLDKYKACDADKFWTPKEKDDFINEVVELIKELFNLVALVKKLIPKFKKK